jgi:hypothetical protein
VLVLVQVLVVLEGEERLKFQSSTWSTCRAGQLKQQDSPCLLWTHNCALLPMNSPNSSLRWFVRVWLSCSVVRPSSETLSHEFGVALQKETRAINTSLSLLKSVITALARREPFVPYRNSCLTKLLRNSLGGNAKTCVVLTISPMPVHARFSRATLTFGQMAQMIINRAQRNEIPEHDGGDVNSSQSAAAAAAAVVQHQLVQHQQDWQRHGTRAPTGAARYGGQQCALAGEGPSAHSRVGTTAAFPRRRRGASGSSHAAASCLVDAQQRLSRSPENED